MIRLQHNKSLNISPLPISQAVIIKQVSIVLALLSTRVCWLNLKSIVALENGMEYKLANAQRANKKQRDKAILARIANRKKNVQHKLSAELVKR